MIICKSSKQHASYVFLSATINIASTSLFNIAPEPKIKTEPKKSIWKIETEGGIRCPCQDDGYEGDNYRFNYVMPIITDNT